MITERQSQILNTIVDEYINTAMPVSSGALFGKGFFGISCPTIRNEMADLTDMGFLVQPHTSAGRVPTERGYRFFVDELIVRKQGRNDARYEEQKSKSKSSRKKITEKARELSQNTNDLVIFLDEEAGEVKYLGLKKVFKNPEFSTHAAVLSMLEELERFENYIDSVEKYLTRDLTIFIGSENPFFENPEYSMISARINDSLIALLGPMRMRYKINLSLLERI
ncbi:MAG: hypothetical protein WAP23_01130 [Candidatus Spechtbacterales bacterium]